MRSRKKELHSQILDNDELPDLIAKMNVVRQELGRLLYPPKFVPQQD